MPLECLSPQAPSCTLESTTEALLSTPLLPIPPFFEAARAAEWSYRPDGERLFEEAQRWRAAHGVKPAGDDRRKVRLLLVDAQKDFCLPEGALFVGGRSGRGAIADSARLARFIYTHLGLLSEITCTLDTHVPHQIFFPSFWLDRDGRPPGAHREISSDDLHRGDLKPNPALASWLAGGDGAWLEAHAAHYCAELERSGKYKLYLWPPHCLLGSEGHALVGVVEEARLFHAFVRGARNSIEVKGNQALTENYSVFSPEVLRGHDGSLLGEKNSRFVDDLLAADVLIIAGQASSHCVKHSVDDLLGEIAARDRRLARKVYLLADCMSAVAVPDPASPGKFLFDFTPQAEEALQRFARAGMNIVASTEPMSAWPGL